MVNIVYPDLNFTNISQNIIAFSIEGYVNVAGFFFWPILFMGIFAYIYLKNQSFVAVAIAIILVFAGFIGEGVFANVGIWVMLLQAFVALIFAGLFVILYLRRRG